MPTEPRCGTFHPPPDGTRDREVFDRFAEFLLAAGRPATRADREAGRAALRSPANRYHLKLLAWRLGNVADVPDPWRP